MSNYCTNGKAPTGTTVEAFSETSPSINKGTIVSNSIALIPVFTGTLADRTVQLCCARALHDFMQVRRDFTTWIKGRVRKFGFAAGEDFIAISRSPDLANGKLDSPDLVNQVRGRGGDRKSTDYHRTLDMAKELSMVENNEQGRAARRYFIACERQALAVAQPTPYTVQPSDTLNEPQQIALRAMLESNVKCLPHAKQAGAMIKGWSKLKAHFGVPYRQIPAGEFEEALSIVARHVSEWELVDEAPKPSIATALAPEESNTKAAFDAATQAAASVQTAVFNAVLSGNDEWKYSRWLLAFVTDSKIAAPAIVQKLPHDAFATSWATLTRDIANGECLRSTPELLDMASACMHRLQQRSSSARLAA